MKRVLNQKRFWPTLLAAAGVVAALGGSVAIGEDLRALSAHAAIQSSAKARTDWRQLLIMNTQYGETCFFQGEQVNGMNKICYYSCPSGDAAITVSAVSLCPLSIQK